MSKFPLPIHATSSSDARLSQVGDLDLGNEESALLWTRFCGAVWDSVGQGAARDVSSLKDVCERLWRPFVKPILDGSYGVREFSKLMIKNRTLFQGESALIENLIPTNEEPKTQVARSK